MSRTLYYAPHKKLRCCSLWGEHLRPESHWRIRRVNLIRWLLSSNQPWKNIEETAAMKKGQNPAQVRAEASVDASPRRRSDQSFSINVSLIPAKSSFLIETIGSWVERLAVAYHQGADDSDWLRIECLLLLRTSTKTSFRIRLFLRLRSIVMSKREMYPPIKRLRTNENQNEPNDGTGAAATGVSNPSAMMDDFEMTDDELLFSATQAEQQSNQDCYQGQRASQNPARSHLQAPVFSTQSVLQPVPSDGNRTQTVNKELELERKLLMKEGQIIILEKNNHLLSEKNARLYVGFAQRRDITRSSLVAPERNVCWRLNKTKQRALESSVSKCSSRHANLN